MTPLFDYVQNLRHTHSFPTSPARRAGAGHWLVAYRNAEESHYSKVNRRVKETHKRRDKHVSAGRTLNKDLLLRLHCVDEPFELSTVSITEQNLNHVNDEGLHLFNNVVQIDAALNFLSLGVFSSFLSLRELNLSLNKLHCMAFDPTDFPHLEVLDLSFNSLSTDALSALGRLPRLKVLHLTENQLHRLPPLQTSEEDAFHSLEVLMLDDNKLSSDVFSCLRNLKRLKYLNLKGNLISEVPLLELLDHLKTQQTSPEMDRDTDGNISDNLVKLMQFFQQRDWDDDKEARFPFPGLLFVNLSENEICEEEALLAVALFPTLREMDISSNPLSTCRRGEPPLLTHLLHHTLHVEIKRKAKQEVKTTAKVKACDVSTNVSKKTRGLDHQTLPHEQIPAEKTPPPFFVTETEDCLYTETSLNESVKDTVDTSHVISTEHIGLQTAVRMLEHALKNLNVYRDSEPRLDSIQTPCRHTHKRIKTLPSASSSKQHGDQLDRMMEEMKLNRTLREVPLSKVIKREVGNRQDYEEAVSLLKDMKDKYKMVHGRTMERAAGLGREQPEPVPVLPD